MRFFVVARIPSCIGLGNSLSCLYGVSRITGAREHTSGGTGLGLSIADRVVRFHGGTIEASNTTNENGKPTGLLMEIRLLLA